MPGHQARISAEEYQGIDYTIFHHKFLWFVSVFQKPVCLPILRNNGNQNQRPLFCVSENMRQNLSMKLLTFRAKHGGGGVPGFSSILSISSMSLQRAKVGFYGEDVRQMHTKSEHEARALRKFFSKLRLFTSILVYVKKVFI